jgi:phosphotransferase system enzyme I (PtsP)
MPASIGAPRILLRRLREVMATQESPQARLDRVVVMIAANMVAEVCSIYVRRRDGSLELFATEGLKRDAVHSTHLKRGEGLVGMIAEQAEPLNLTEAQDHPAFSYRPETGEEIYHSFLGVPILRGGHTLGVLTVQNRAQRTYSDEEIEALQTTSMVLAELIASGDLGAIGDQTVGRQTSSQRRQAVVLSEGIALGRVALHEPRVAVSRLIAEDMDAERARLEEGIAKLREMVEGMLERGDLARIGEHRDVLEAYRMFAHDRGWLRRIQEALSTGLTAEAAVERVQNDTRARMLRQTDPYLRERLHDLDDLSNRLLRLLMGMTPTAASHELPDDAVLFARTMGPAELLDYDRAKLRGLVLDDAGPSSHVAIVARALGLAAISDGGGLIDLAEPGDPVIVDAEAGEMHLRPSSDVVAAYADKVRFRAQRQAKYASLRERRAETRDGQHMQLMINAGLLVDLPHLAQSGADGIGLFRTELQFMIGSTMPRLEDQAALYSSILDQAGERPVTFRFLDIGGDKGLPYFRGVQEENPALGWRAIRITLDRPALFRTQARALLRAAGGRELRMMIPMVADASEFAKARDLIDREHRLLSKHGRAEPAKLSVGAMIEVPALLWQLDRLLPLVDFVSVGSNDLFQFMFAVDRGNSRVASRFDSLNPAILRALKRIVDACASFGVPVTLCGEIAGRPLEAMALIGLGFRSISMAPANIGPVKAMVMSLDAAACAAAVEDMLREDSSSVRERLKAFAVSSNVEI